MFAAAVVWFSWGLATPSPWRDEVASVVAANRSWPDLWSLLHHVDLVHGLYYVLVHPVLAVWPSVTPLRLLSMLAMALTAALVVRIGRRLASTPVGVCAGLLLVLSPMASRYAQEARPFAWAALFATAATLALVRALAAYRGEREPPRRAGRWAVAEATPLWIGYGALLGLAILFNVVGGAVVLVHAGFVAADLRQTPARRRARLLRCWVVTVGVTVAVLAPFLWEVAGQRGQVAWRTGATDLSDLLDAFRLVYGSLWAPATLLVIAVGLALTPARRLVSVRALALGLWWGVLPVVLLWVLAFSLPAAHVLFDPRYLIFILPGTALALGSCARVGRVLPASSGRWRGVTLGAAVPLVALAVSGASLQGQVRHASTGHVEDMRSAVRALEGRVQAGDAVLFVPGYLSIFGDYFTTDFEPLDDVARQPRPPAPTAITDPDLPTAGIAPSLAGHDRVWVVASVADLTASAPSDQEKLRLLREHFHPVDHQVVPFFNVWLFERN